jgi:hypothetical protein
VQSDLIFVSLENWDEIWRRNQFVCAELSRRHPDMQILFVGLPRDLSHAVRRGRLSRVLGPATYPAPGYPGITITRSPKLLPNSVSCGRWINNLMFRRHVRNVSRKLGLRRPVLWLNPHYSVHSVGRMNESAVIYDITDDWTCLSQSAGVARRTVAQDAELCRRADATIVCSPHLRDMKQGLARQLHLIPNGVDASHYAKVTDGSADVPTVARNWPKPVLGYTGTLHPDRIDLDLIKALAASHQGSIVLVGPNFLSPVESERLLNLGNVFLPGPVPYARIPDYMAAFDQALGVSRRRIADCLDRRCRISRLPGTRPPGSYRRAIHWRDAFGAG